MLEIIAIKVIIFVAFKAEESPVAHSWMYTVSQSFNFDVNSGS